MCLLHPIVPDRSPCTLIAIIAWTLIALPILSDAKMERVHVDFDYVAAIAAERAASEAEILPLVLPSTLAALDYDQYRRIRFRRDSQLWRKEGRPWALEFFHPGYLFPTPVQINEFTNSHVQEIRFVSTWFDYGGMKLGTERMPTDLHYPGFKLLYPLHSPTKFDEVASFLGASYFRMLGQGQSYGVSARGLAINAGREGPESFPAFTRFWLGKPGQDSTSVVVYALLEGAELTGAYRFEIEPGRATRCLVRARLFFRTEVSGPVTLAPFSSMFLRGENNPCPRHDFRPEVHDTDGVRVFAQDGSEHWIPHQGGRRKRVETYSLGPIFGFGVMQRDRNFASYQDLEANYQARPSVWVTPGSHWPEGSVSIVELPSIDEGADSIVVGWDLATPPPLGTPLDFDYTLSWQLNDSGRLGRVMDTRLGQNINEPSEMLAVVDFSGPLLTEATIGREPLARVNVGAGALVSAVRVEKNPHIDGWRLVIHLRVDELAERGGELPAPVSMSGALVLDEQTLTETWHYSWAP